MRNCDNSTVEMENDTDYRLILEFSDDGSTSQSDTTSEVEIPEYVPIRQSTRQRRQPDYYGREECNLSETPTTYKEALSGIDKPKWKKCHGC